MHQSRGTRRCLWNKSIADLEFFKYMMRLTRTGVKVVGGVQPMLAAFNRLHLQPLQGAKRKADATDEDKAKRTSTTENEKLKRTIENLEGQVRTLQRAAGKGQKGKGKGKAAKFIRLPPPLLGMAATNKDGEPMSYDYNLKGCNRAKPGERRSKGFHQCMVPGCGKAHSQKGHT